MYVSGRNPLQGVRRDDEPLAVAKDLKVRRLHKAFLRYHDPNNWPMLRAALHRMGRSDLIGSGKHQLVPRHQPAGTGAAEGRRRKGKTKGPRPGSALTQHTGLPPRDDGSRKPKRRRKR